jgi:pyruvate,water dikinase
MSDLFKLGKIPAKYLSLVGGKAKNLDKLIKAGFPVPPGFVITCDSYHQFLKSANLVDMLPKKEEIGDASLLKQRYAHLSQIIPQEILPFPLSDRILEYYQPFQNQAVAVRSSATQEDSQQYSFAGQFETYLNINQKTYLFDAIKNCWASLWSNRALSYQLKHQTGLVDRQIAVVVQQLVPAQIAGVIFTRNPMTNNPNHLLIEASWGLGEAIVAGKTMTDTFVVDIQQQKIVKKTINYKLTMCVANADNGIDEVKVPEAKRSQVTLRDDQVLELTNLALSIREFYQAEQDIEWAFDGDQFYILQSRPITTISPIETASNLTNSQSNYSLFTCLDIGESFTGVFTPLGESFADYYLHHTHGAILSGLGLQDIGNPNLYGQFLFGRAYLDLSYFAYLYAQCFLFRDQGKFLERFASEEIDIKHYKNPYGKGAKAWRYLKANIFYLQTLIKTLLFYPKQSQKFIGYRLNIFDKYLELKLENLNLYDLHDKLKEAYRYYHDSCVIYGPAYIGAFIFYDVLHDLSKAWLSKNDESIPELLKAGASELRTTEVIKAIEELAEEARQIPQLKQAILTLTPLEILKVIDTFPEATSFLVKYRHLLRVHGVRAHQEMELTHPRWIDNPSYIFTTLKTYLTQDNYGLIATREARNAQRVQLANHALEKLSTWQQKVYQFVMNRYLKLSHIREDLRMGFIQGIWMNRLLIFEVVRRLVDENILNSTEEAALITYDEILTYTSGTMSPEILFSREKLEQRRRTYCLNKQIPSPPLTFIGHWDPSEALSQQSHSDRLVGVGCSSGKVVGKARIILDLEEQMDEFKPGDILVTRSTDTAWTPLFNMAGAVVVDIGSLLSHSAIVARELGIPGVVNTKVATQTICTGDTLIVDGDTGVVLIQKAAETP